MIAIPVLFGAVCGECNEPLVRGEMLGYALDDRSHIVIICRPCDIKPRKRSRTLKPQLSHIARLQSELDSIKPHYERLLEEERARRARIKRTNAPRDLRMAIIIRDDYTCRYCGKMLDDGTVTVDHVLPVSRGGKHTADNIVAACRPCNYRKKTQTPDEAGMTLRPIPSGEILA